MKSELGNRVAVIVITLCSVLAWATSNNVRADNRMVKIVMIGDSLTEGKVPEIDRIPIQLEFALKAKGQSVSVTNAGVGGDSAAKGLARLNRVVTDDTDAVILALGWWDMVRGLDPNVTQTALAAILDNLEARKIAVLLCGVRAHTNFGDEHEKAFAAMFAGLSHKYNVLFFPAINEAVLDNAELKAVDGLHPNAAGNKAIVAQILPTIEALIDRARPTDRDLNALPKR
ncbi:GDSL-type esterase/lipase family protein [Bradyrhizobium japonicum]|uniref:GDSL-type esterase/lipase family protein n=1 Tax=Bradyrhizobium japonicum TaxID=375 RepID=UPI001BAC9629|nr:GDSL-type esterase/lipase family protein [Bradyrhizobium japonicum]MBR0910818.1 lysophospholipase [Bradyrhizobium japonicum]